MLADRQVEEVDFAKGEKFASRLEHLRHLQVMRQNQNRIFIGRVTVLLDHGE